MFYFVFFLAFVIGHLTLDISSFAAPLPPIIPDSVNTNEIYSGSFDPEYPNKEFVPNDPSGVSCEFEVSDEQSVGDTSTTPTGPVTINKKMTNQKVDYDNRVTTFSLYNKTQCPDGPDYDQCVRFRNNSMDAANAYGASSPYQRNLPQSEKNKLYCARWHSGILSGAHIAETDERVGCYLDENTFTSNKDCPSDYRAVYFSELIFEHQSFCDIPSDIDSYYDCSGGSCPAKKREPKFSGIISKKASDYFFRESSMIAKGSAASRITQEEAGKSTIAAMPNLMAVSTKNGMAAANVVLPAKATRKTTNPNCSPVIKSAGPDEYRLDFLAAIKAFFDGIGDKVSGKTTIKQEFSSDTINGLNTVDDSSKALIPASYQAKNPVPETNYGATDNTNNGVILNPGTQSNEYLRQNLTPQSWKHI